MASPAWRGPPVANLHMLPVTIYLSPETIEQAAALARGEIFPFGIITEEMENAVPETMSASEFIAAVVTDHVLAVSEDIAAQEAAMVQAEADEDINESWKEERLAECAMDCMPDLVAKAA